MVCVNTRRSILRVSGICLLLIFTAWSVNNLTSTPDRIAQLGAIFHDAADSEEVKAKADFVEKTLSNGIYKDAYDGSAIRSLCSETQWREGYFISCDSSIAGGIGNIKIGVIGCVRFAIAAGGMLNTEPVPGRSAEPIDDLVHILTRHSASVIMPSIHERTAFGKMGDSFDWKHGLGLDYLIDYDHLVSTLRAECPQLAIIESNKTVEASSDMIVPSDDEKYSVNPKTLGATKWGNVLSNPHHWRADLDAWIDREIIRKKGHASPSKATPIRVDLLDTAFAWPPASDGKDFARNFGRIIKFPKQIQRISARALYHFYAKIGIHDSPSAISEGAFLGAHLRTEGDAQVEGWQSYEMQCAHIREELQRYNLSIVYVASGNQTQVDLLQVDLSDLRIPINSTHNSTVRVYQKWDLFDSEDAEAVKELRWDQLGLVDMDIMFRASKFLGLAESSFSWTIALERHDWSQQNPYGHEVTFKDEFSTLSGSPGAMQLVPATVWL